MGKILIIIAVVLLLAGGGFYFYQSSQKPAEKADKENSGVSVLSATEAPTPAEAKADAFSIEILNGSGIAGEAGRAKELLEGKEFKVDSTGNADNYDFEDSVIKAGSSVDEAWIDLLRDALGKNYSVKPGVEELDSADSESDVVVIIGSLDEDGKSMAAEEEAAADTESADATESAEVTDTPAPTKSPTPTP